jgi:hypothetical protein
MEQSLMSFSIKFLGPYKLKTALGRQKQFKKISNSLLSLGNPLIIKFFS